MSVVWRADDDVLGREVAVKVLAAAMAGDPDQRRQIRDEARSAARLRHANVVAVYDYGEVTDAGRTMSYVVMELVDGRSLADMLTGGRLPWKVTALVGAQVAAALAAAHADGIVHRDVKPGNVMVTSSGVKLVDFGISAAVGALDSPDGQVLGTPAYLAPERIEGSPVRPETWSTPAGSGGAPSAARAAARKFSPVTPPSWRSRSGGLERLRLLGEGEAELEQLVDGGQGPLAGRHRLAGRVLREPRAGDGEVGVRGGDAGVEIGELSAVGHG